MKKIWHVILLLLLICDSSLLAFDLKTGLKESARELFAQMTPEPELSVFAPLPPGFKLINGEGYRGFKIIQGKLEIRIHTWNDDTGLLENYQRCKEEKENLIAMVNGTFFSSRGVLGQVISDTTFPPGIIQSSGKLSRCFIASFRGDKNRQSWYLGETSLSGEILLGYGFKERGWFNVPEVLASHCDNLLGGGGWILRQGRDVHRESEERQRFRFAQADKKSRKTVIAQDAERNLYFIVFETGRSFHQVALALTKETNFSQISEAIFLDGGSSSAIVVNGHYLVAPLYLVDRSRFSAIQILVPELTW